MWPMGRETSTPCSKPGTISRRRADTRVTVCATNKTWRVYGSNPRVRKSQLSPTAWSGTGQYTGDGAVGAARVSRYRR